MSTDELYGSAALIDLETRLIAKFSPPLRPEEVQRCLIDAVASLATSRIQVYLPVLIERAATDRLRLAVAHDDGRVATGTSSSRFGTESSRGDRGDSRTNGADEVADELGSLVEDRDDGLPGCRGWVGNGGRLRPRHRTPRRDALATQKGNGNGPER
jgi:hypothetical protein